MIHLQYCRKVLVPRFFMKVVQSFRKCLRTETEISASFYLEVIFSNAHNE